MRRIMESSNTTSNRKKPLSKNELGSKRKTAVENISKRNILMIDKEWGLEFITKNVSVIKKGYTDEKVPKIDTRSYHGTLEGAIYRVYKLMIEEQTLESSIETIEQLKDVIEKSNEEVRTAISTIRFGESDGETKSKSK